MTTCAQLYNPELFFQAFEHSPSGMAVQSTEGNWLYVNAAVCRMTGYTEAELRRMTLRDIAHPNDLEIERTARHQLLDGKIDSYELELRLIRKDGSPLSVQWVTFSMRDEHDHPLYLISQIEDITDTKASEAELQATTEQLQSFIENNADAIWMIDAEDILLDVNPSFEKLFGWSAAEAIGKKLPIVPDELKDTIAEIHRGIMIGETVAGFETVRRRKDGTFIHVEATLSPLRDRTGTIVGITGICRDVTKRKQAEEDLQAKTEQLESFIENNADAILILNIDSVVQRINGTFENVFGWSKEEIVGVPIDDLPFVPVEYGEEVARMREHLRTGQPIIYAETIRKRKNGEPLNVALTVSPILDGSGKVNGCSITLRDITERNIAQEHVRNSEKLAIAGQLAAGIAHEIRNPITSIKGFTQLMRSGVSEKQAYYEIMASEIERIELILNELLILAKPQTIKFERKDICAILNQVMTLLDSQANLNGVEFETRFDSVTPYLYCDENQLKQVFINFIKNAIESMPSGGKLIIEAVGNDDGQMVIRLVDEGCGIPADVLSKLGQPFYTTKEKGTGLGFMVSRKIIEQHSGSILIESEVNKGTVIEITLPVNH